MQRRELLKLSLTLLASSTSASVSSALLAGEPPARALSEAFTEAQGRAIVLLSDMIIPPTDTPGAVAAGVPDFIAGIVSDWYNDTECGIFFEGLRSLDQHCHDAEGKPFHQASEPTRVAALTMAETVAADYVSSETAGHPMEKTIDENLPFFNKIRELVVLGYYTSEVGAKQELIYLPVPGQYDGDYDFSKVGRQWIS